MSWSDLLHELIGRDEPKILWWQMSVRAAVIFLFGLLVVRLFGRRAFGKHSPLDVVLAIIIGSNLSRALTANAPFLPTLAASAVIVLLYWLFEHVSARSRVFSRVVKGDPIWLLRDGRLDARTMRSAGLSEGDLEEAARASGIRNLSEVGEAVFERSGDISTVRRSREE